MTSISVTDGKRKGRAHWIPVVTALILRENKLLVGLRPQGQNLAGTWEFPGGKIESEESPEIALARELKEELNVNAEIGPLAMAATHNYGNTGIVLLFYVVQFWKGEIKPVHHTELRWITPEELKELPLPEANRRILPRLLAAIEKFVNP